MNGGVGIGDDWEEDKSYLTGEATCPPELSLFLLDTSGVNVADPGSEAYGEAILDPGGKGEKFEISASAPVPMLALLLFEEGCTEGSVPGTLLASLCDDPIVCWEESEWADGSVTFEVCIEPVSPHVGVPSLSPAIESGILGEK